MKVLELYKQYDPWQDHPDVFQKDFYPEHISIRLRPFSIHEDYPLLNQWIYQEMKEVIGQAGEASLVSENYFVALLESSNAQSFWGFVNNQPAFQADIYKASDYHQPDHSYWKDLGSGDVMLQLVVSPGFLNNELAVNYILPVCLEYLNSFPEIKKVYWVLDQQDVSYEKMATDAGFTLAARIEQGKRVYLYTCLQF